MGRHSAPDDDEDYGGDSLVAAPTAPIPDPAPTTPDPESATSADLRLIRENRSVRAQCVAAVVIPFALYTVLMVTIGRADVFLLWVWIPIVLAGVVAGTVLDRAHRAARR